VAAAVAGPRRSGATPQPTSTAREVVRRTRRWRFSDQRAASGSRPVSIAARRSSAEDLRSADAESIGGWARLCRLRWDRGGGREPVRFRAGDRRAGGGELQCNERVSVSNLGAGAARGNLLCGAGVRRGCSAPARDDEYGRVRLRVVLAPRTTCRLCGCRRAGFRFIGWFHSRPRFLSLSLSPISVRFSLGACLNHLHDSFRTEQRTGSCQLELQNERRKHDVKAFVSLGTNRTKWSVHNATAAA
jgi:hypothetical protein